MNFIRHLANRKRLGSCRQGTTVLEFAIIAPVLFLLLMGIIELGLIYFTTSVLENATYIGSRLGTTGISGGSGSREDFLRDQIRQRAMGLVDVNLLDIQMLVYSDFSNIGQPEPCADPPACSIFTDVNGNGMWDADQGIAGAGGAGSVVLYRVSYPWSIFTPLMRQLIGDANGNLTLTAVATVRGQITPPPPSS